MGQASTKKLKRQVKKNQRELEREIRNVDRDIKGIEKEEAKLKAQIRTEAEKGNTEKVRTMAKQIIRCQKHQRTLDQTRGRLKDVKLELSSMLSMALMTETMKKITKMMTRINKQTNAIKMGKIMQKYEQEKMKAEMNQEMMDDLMDEYSDEAAEDELVEQVLAEAGLANIGELENTPAGLAAKQTAPVAVGVSDGAQGEKDEAEVDDLEARMRRLANNDKPKEDGKGK